MYVLKSGEIEQSQSKLRLRCEIFMNLWERVQYHVLSPFLSHRRQQTLKSQYLQWQLEGYSRIVQCEMILLFILFFITSHIPQWFRVKANACIHYLSGISPELYVKYERRYLDPWHPMHLHVRLLVRVCPTLIPISERRATYNRYKIWQMRASLSPSKALDLILDHFDSRDVDPNWYIHVRNIVEFTIWGNGRIEKPFHLRAHGRWELKDFPDPKYKDPIRYALAASILEQLVDVFNWRSQLGIRRDYVQTGRETRIGKRWDVDYPPFTPEYAPMWTKYVPPSPIPLVIHSAYADDGMSFDEVLANHGELDPPNGYFLKRSLIADKNFLQFV
jgi:hypothetical protein